MAADAEEEYDLMDHRHFFDFLVDANIRLVRAEYLYHLEKEKRLWPRRQEAEHETFQDEDGSVKTALVTLEEYQMSSRGRIILSVSHCWEAKQHPDPFGYQARELLSELDPGKWVFIDFICLPQYYRTPEEQVFFKRAMANMHVLYAHDMCGVWCVRLEELTDESAKASPPDFIDIYYEEEGAEPGSGKFGPQPFNKLELNDTPYHERGWCEAEKQWMSTSMIIQGFAPMTPARFRERVERGHQKLPDGLVLKFTHRSDEEIVIKLQEKIFLQQAPRRQRLCAAGLPESLPHFVNLEWLFFCLLDIGETSAVALIAGLKTLRHLKYLRFRDSCRIEEEAAKVLTNGLVECKFAGDLLVHVSNEPGPKKLANELRSLEGTGRVHEHSWSRLVRFLGCRRLKLLGRDLTDAQFTIKGAAEVEEGSKVGWLRQQLAQFSCCSPCATPDDVNCLIVVVVHV